MTSDDRAVSSDETPQAKKASLSPDQIKGAAAQFSDALGETSPKPVAQIGQLIEKCGFAFVEKIMAETEAIEAEGGLLTHDRKRRRSKGGVFFYLAKGQMDAALRAQIFPNFGKGGDGTIAPPGIEWGKRIEPMKALHRDAGQISGLTVTLSGRPGKLHIDGSSVMTVIEQRQVKAPPYPKGVPHFDTVDGVTSYYIFMSLRHWKRVEKALEDESDLLVVEGSAVFDAKLEGITVLSTRVSTKKLDYQKRKAKTLGAQSSATPTAKDESVEREASAADERELSGLPPEAAEKLQQLQKAADNLRQKLAAMEEGDQESGQKMTRRLLKQTEKQIATIKRRYNR
ncbi:MAG: hypothetical protein OXI30_07665 [Chloroflexota bacterium]|nr:hypothetical protein [Chloroflexota bacterium]